ncbi:MAG: ATP-binding protein [Bacteroidota bacterium]|jgi:hypothetical protein
MVRNQVKNPFEYWHVVGEESFCNRRKEVAELLRVMENAGRAFIYGERRLGKTSFVKLALGKLPVKKFIPVYIDLWPTDSDASFITTVAKAITASLSTSLDKALETAKQFFSHLRPSLTLDEDGKPMLSFGIVKSTRLEPELEEVLTAPERIGGKGKTVVIVFDEFQQILMYGRDDIERKLRSIIQHQKNVAYVFMGSRKHMIREIFLKGSKPLYRSATQFPIGPVNEQDWLPFIQERFHRGKGTISPEQIHTIIELTQGHPFYTQHLCYHLWELCIANQDVTQGLIHEALNTLLEKENSTFTVQWESLTLNQQHFLKALATEERGAKPFSADFLQRYRLGSASSAQRAIRSLVDKDIVDQDNGSFIILDRFFRLWIRRLNAGM